VAAGRPTKQTQH
jgi:hypothetical protein